MARQQGLSSASSSMSSMGSDSSEEPKCACCFVLGHSACFSLHFVSLSSVLCVCDVQGPIEQLGRSDSLYLLSPLCPRCPFLLDRSSFLSLRSLRVLLQAAVQRLGAGQEQEGRRSAEQDRAGRETQRSACCFCLVRCRCRRCVSPCSCHGISLFCCCSRS